MLKRNENRKIWIGIVKGIHEVTMTYLTNVMLADRFLEESFNSAKSFFVDYYYLFFFFLGLFFPLFLAKSRCPTKLRETTHFFQNSRTLSLSVPNGRWVCNRLHVTFS